MPGIEEVREKVLAAVAEPKTEPFDILSTGSLLAAFNREAPADMRIPTPDWLLDIQADHIKKYFER